MSIHKYNCFIVFWCKLPAVVGQEDSKLRQSNLRPKQKKTKHFWNMYNTQLGRGYVIINIDTLNDPLLSKPVCGAKIRKAGPV